MIKRQNKPKDLEWTKNPVNDHDGRVCGPKGRPGSKIIAEASDSKKHYFLHATKGYRTQSKRK